MPSSSSSNEPTRQLSNLLELCSVLSLRKIDCESVLAKRTLDHSTGESKTDLARKDDGFRSSSLAVTTVVILDGKRGRRDAFKPVMCSACEMQARSPRVGECDGPTDWSPSYGSKISSSDIPERTSAIAVVEQASLSRTPTRFWRLGASHFVTSKPPRVTEPRLILVTELDSPGGDKRISASVVKSLVLPALSSPKTSKISPLRHSKFVPRTAQARLVL